MKNKKSGYALLALIIFLGVLIGLISALIADIGRNWKALRYDSRSTAAFWAAEAGVEKGMYELERQGPQYAGEETAFENGAFRVTFEKKSGSLFLLTSTGRVGNSPGRTVQVEVVLQTNPSGGYQVKKKNWKMS